MNASIKGGVLARNILLTPPQGTGSNRDSSAKTNSDHLINKVEKNFNQQLQWRILNLLAQQLFDRNGEQLTESLLPGSKIYRTKTFTVSITSQNTDYYQVLITDSHQKNTQLEIPRL